MGIPEQKTTRSDLKMSTNRFNRIFQTNEDKRAVKEKLCEYKLREKNV